MLNLPIYKLGPTYYLHTRIHGQQVKRSLGTDYKRIAIMRAVSLLNELTMNKLPPGVVPSKYELDIDRGCLRRSKTEPPCRMNREPGVEADAVMVGCG